MIIVKLMGGLGNQMFQYAAARSLAWKLGTSLIIDLSFLEGDQVGNTPRVFRLDKHCISAEKASNREKAFFSHMGRTRLETVAIALLQKITGYTVYREKCCTFDPIVLTLSGNVYLEGYWQSEKYFEGVRDILLEEFKLKTSLEGLNLNLAEEIMSKNAVSVHVRRGDYVADRKTNEMHGVCSLDYYMRAEELVAATVKEPLFFVFSDDPEWSARNLRLRHPVRYVNHNGPEEAHEDLRLMSMCNHHIIANSSFSWWGAWLSTSPDKKVIAPNRWFDDLSIDTRDLIPSGWQRL